MRSRFHDRKIVTLSLTQKGSPAESPRRSQNGECRTVYCPSWSSRPMSDFVFDPRVFILPPFRDCPSCGREGTYGVLMISGVRYTRRCRECWHADHYPLPPLEKKVIYLD